MPSDFAGAGSPLTQAQFDHARAALQVDDAVLWSLLTVETRGFGFLTDRRPKILFERHIFHARTHGRFDRTAPDLSNPQAGGYAAGDGAGEHDRLARAMALDRGAALESASWGLGQVMGFNAVTAGYSDVEAMVSAFVVSEGEQLNGAARFIGSQAQLAEAAQTRDWKTFARLYNGSNYAKNQYDQKLGDNYAVYARGPLPNLDLRAAQACLAYLGYDPHGIDGVMGRRTREALAGFQAAAHLPATGALDSACLAALRTRAGV
jgi:N-acetylmuramidase-like protein/putative peptidoglycan binding protein